MSLKAFTIPIHYERLFVNIDNEGVINELMSEANLVWGSEKLNDKIITDRPGLELTNELIEYLKDNFNLYFEKELGLCLKDFEVSTNVWAMGLNDGEGLEPHSHPNSQFTLVYYLTDSEAELAVQDPRAIAHRLYPKKIRDVLFHQQSFKPRAGHVLILPSFLTHYARRITPERRISLVMDFYINEK